MAVFSIADMSAALPTVYRKMVSQVQRKAVLLRLLSQLGALRRSTTGNTMTWTVKFSGQDAGAVDLDGGAFRTASSDVPVAASLAFGSYDAPVKVTDRMLWTGGSNGGLGADINTLADPIAENMKDAIEQWVKTVNQQLYAGLGTSNAMVGLATAIASSGLYANINTSAQSAWASTVTLNSGVLRSLTLGLIKTILRTIAVASKMGRPDICVCPPALMDAVESLFEAYTRINYSPSDGMAMPGQGERVSLNPPIITTAGGRINADGFRVFHWQNQRLWFIEDPDCTYTGATNPANAMYFLNSADCDVQYVTPPGLESYVPTATTAQIQAAEQDFGTLATMPLLLLPRGRTQHSYEADISGLIGIKLESRNAHGILGDIQ